MAVSKARDYRGMYIGSLSEERAREIIKVKEEGVLPSLKHTICRYSDELVELSIKEGESIRKILQERGEKSTEYLGELRDEQTVGLAFMYYSPRSILGDGVGLGKTIETAALINLLYAKKELSRFLVVVENTAVDQVQKELIRFTGLNIVKIKSLGLKLERDLEDIDWGRTNGLVVSHSKLKTEVMNKFLARHLTESGKSKIFNTFILDESSVVKNPSTSIYRAVKEVCRIVDRVHFLNATTFELSLKDVYTQLDLLDEEVLPKWWRIEKEFCVMENVSYWKTENHRPVQKFHRRIVGYKNESIFKDRIGLYFLGRSIGHLAGDNRYSVRVVYPTEAQRRAIRRGSRYMEVLNCPSLVEGADIPMTVESVPKLRELEELLREREGKSVFIYCYNIEAQEKLRSIAQELGREPAILNGSTVAQERQDLVDRFNVGEIDTLISNIQRSLNLYAGDTCIYYSIEGNPARMEQIRGRIDRHVDDKTKEFILLVYKGTDEYQWLVDTAKVRSKAASALTVESETAVDCFIAAMVRDGQIKLVDRG